MVSNLCLESSHRKLIRSGFDVDNADIGSQILLTILTFSFPSFHIKVANESHAILAF